MRTRATLAVCMVGVFLLHGCVSTRVQPSEPNRSAGMASWYGQEFAGRTTANGEIFDPLLLTAAHRTFPFGTVLEVRNPKNGKSVTVRVNDRGPFVGNRILDLSYGAAEKLGMIETGIGYVEMNVVKLGRGDREPPAPYVVKIAPSSKKAPEQGAAPKVDFPLPDTSGRRKARADESGETFRVDVVEERGGKVTRKKVAADGVTLEDEVVGDAPASRAADPVAVVTSERRRPATETLPKIRYLLQLGAFSIEKNAEELRGKAAAVIDSAFIERSGELFRVRVGPWQARSDATRAREQLERAGLAAIVITE